MSNKWKRIGQDAWVEIDEPTEVFAYRNRTHHPIANLESGWRKDGDVKGEDEIKFYYGKDGVIKIYQTPFKPQPMSERKEDQQPSGDVEKAAVSYVMDINRKTILDTWYDKDWSAKESFIAGAKWDREKQQGNEALIKEEKPR